MQSHSEFREERVNAFVCNVVNDDLSRNVNPSSVDVVTLVRVGNHLIQLFSFLLLVITISMVWNKNHHECGQVTCSADFYVVCSFSEKDALDITEYQSSVKGRSTISSVEIVSVYPLCVSTIMPFYELCSQMAIFLCAIMLLEILLK